MSLQDETHLNDLLAKRNIKDSVFTSLFRDNRYVLALYQALFPEDKTATVDDIETVTLEYDLVNAYYNDLGFLVDNRLIVLVEAQSQWSDNIIVRVFLYLAQTWKNYIDSHDDLDLHSTKKVTLPKPELFVIYTGEQEVKDVVSYRADFLDGADSNIDIRVKVIRDGQEGDIIHQYVCFTKVLAEQMRLYGRTRKAVMETIRVCKNQNVLKEYFESREEEVISIMIALYDYENSFNKRIRLERQEAIKEGREEGKKEGKEEGKEEQARKTALNFYTMGISIEDIARGIGYKTDIVRQWLGLPS